MPENRDAIRTAVLLAGLDLNLEQARHLLGISDRAVAARAKVEEEIQTSMTGAFSTYERPMLLLLGDHPRHLPSRRLIKRSSETPGFKRQGKRTSNME